MSFSVPIKHLYIIYLRRKFLTASDVVHDIQRENRLVLRVHIINLAYYRILVEKIFFYYCLPDCCSLSEDIQQSY